MRKLLALISLILCFVWISPAQLVVRRPMYAAGGFATFDKGFNFRSTAGFVTDGTDETYVILEAYPVTRNGVTFGWANISQVQDRNRSAAVDRRFAGIMFQDGSLAVDQRFQVDLPAAGTYDIRLALGDVSNGFPNSYSYKIYDNATLKTTISGASLTSSAATFRDAANGGPYSTANWPGSNTAISVTFASTTMYLDLVYSGSGVVVPIAHMRIVRTA